MRRSSQSNHRTSSIKVVDDGLHLVSWKILETQKEEITAQAGSLQTAYNNLEHLSDIGKIITSQLTVEKIIDTVYESINQLMDANVFGIGILNKEKNTIDFPGVKEKGETLDFFIFRHDFPVG